MANLPIIKGDTFQDPFLIMEYKIQTCLSSYVFIGLKICKRIVVKDMANEAIGVFPNNNPNKKNALHNNIANTNQFHK